ncbi:MAG: hypothetical protein HZB53_12150 [Chloroflexi bacterium]|nr:hypothetical protein [Chloroflexota bacterium]
MMPPLPAWAAASLAAHTLAAALNALLANRVPDAWRRLSGVSWIARALYFVGIPYLALIGGVVTPAQLALARPATAQAGAALPALAAWLLAGAMLIGLYGLVVRRFYPADVRPAVRRRAQLARPWGFAFIGLDTLYLQAHWAFYRAAAAAALDVNGRDAAVLAGLALVGTEWLLDPAWWRDMARAGLWEDRVLVGALAVASATLYMVTANFFISLAAHALLWLAWLGLWVWLYRPPRAGTTTTQPPEATA